MTFPITDFARVNITQVVDARMPKPRYRRSRVEGNQRPYWMLEITSTALPYNEAMGAAAYLDSLKGGLTLFSFPMPLPALTIRSGLTNYAANAKDSAIANIGGFTANQPNASLGGDFIQFTNHQKVYRLVNTKNATAAGRVIADITPELFVGTTTSEAIKYGSDVSFQVCLDDYVTMEVTANNGKFVVFNLTLIEQG